MSTTLENIATRLAGWQKELGYSNAEMVRKFPDLGSDKTYAKILKLNGEGLDLDRWLRDYEKVLNVLDAGGGAATEEEILPLRNVEDLRIALSEAMREGGNTRLIIVQGPSGAGKTTALRALKKKWGNRIALVEADESWKGSPNSMLASILKALGEPSAPASMREKLDKVLALLRTRTTLAIDEAHHMGPRELNVVKTLINQAPGEIVLAAMGSLMVRLELNAYAEAQQLVHNRLHERIRLDDLHLADVSAMLAPLGLNGDLRKGAELVANSARTRGHLKFVRRVVRLAPQLAGSRDSVDLASLSRACEAAARRM
jgi:type II secretory pathway predicted ATPase ExeA